MIRHLPVIVAAMISATAIASDLSWVELSNDHRKFIFAGSTATFTPWGFNYDHDENGRLIEDYWEAEWGKVEQDFGEMKELGANVVRIHLQLGKFMESATQANQKSLDKLGRLVRLVEKLGLYLDLTGLGCYHKPDVPPWYDQLSESERWDVQARFWEAIASRCASSPAVFCYDLMNEPVVPGNGDKRDDWLGPPFFDGSCFVQFITLETKDRPRHKVAQAWIRHLVAAIRKVDRRHLITVGLVSWSLDRPGLSSGFIPDKIAADLDFIAVHFYPDSGKEKEAIKTLQGFSVGKPIVIEEMFPLACTADELGKFIDDSATIASGWIGFYWGKTPAECRLSGTIGDALTLSWLELFEAKAKTRER